MEIGRIGSDLTESTYFDGSICLHDPVPHSSNPNPNPSYFMPNGAPFRQLHMLNVCGTMQDRCDAIDAIDATSLS